VGGRCIGGMVCAQRRDPTASHSSLVTPSGGQSGGAGPTTKDQATRSSDADKQGMERERESMGARLIQRRAWPDTPAPSVQYNEDAVAADSVTPRVNPSSCLVTDEADPWESFSETPAAAISC